MQEQMKIIKEKMNKSVEVLKGDFAAIRAGRANPAVLDKVNVDYYGVPTPIQQMAAVSVAEARVLVIQPWDASTLKAIEKASESFLIRITDERLLRKWSATAGKMLPVAKATYERTSPAKSA